MLPLFPCARHVIIIAQYWVSSMNNSIHLIAPCHEHTESRDVDWHNVWSLL